MLGDMTRTGLLLVVACAFAQPAVAGPRPTGKVVRVERVRASTAVPRICDVQADRTGNCFGPEPRIGDIITLVDDTGVIGEARIAEASTFAIPGRQASPGKGCDGLWTVKTDLLRGDLTGAFGRTVGVIDAGMHPRQSRMIPKDQLASPTGRAEDTAAMGFDRDGDRVADIVLLNTMCDGSGNMCIEEWVRSGTEMKRVYQVNFQSCGL